MNAKPRLRFDPYTGREVPEAAEGQAAPEPAAEVAPAVAEAVEPPAELERIRFVPHRPGAGYVALLVLGALFFGASAFAADEKAAAAAGAVIAWVAYAVVVTAFNYVYRRSRGLP